MTSATSATSAPSATSATSAAPAASVANAAGEPNEIAQSEPAQDAVSQAQKDLAVARKSLDAAQAAYQSMRHHRRVRGTRKRLVIETLARAEAELADAENALDVATAAARRAGVTPGWFRVNRDALPASPTHD